MGGYDKSTGFIKRNNKYNIVFIQNRTYNNIFEISGGCMKLGNVATGDDFFDREFIREYIWVYLKDNHLVLRGVRRLGKSSILIRIGEEAEKKGLLVAYKDVGGATTAEQFIAWLEELLPDTTYCY